MARFAMVDDATALRASIAVLLPSLRFTSVHRSVEELLRERPEADVVILDLHLANVLQPVASQGIAAVRQVIEAGYRVCVYTQEERRFVLAACLAAGALGVVSKAASMEEAEASFAAVADGELVTPPAVTGLIEVLARRGALTILTPRQRDVLAGRARGLTYAELSRSLFLSESTLRGYWRDLTDTVSRYLQATSPGDIERALGLGPGDLVDLWPETGP
ncbi:response regulator transcription factor [Glycomyces endophyticus]|uniref:Response regulator transcription factor n=1 Tax=Glycomyces endophyticus TaxID=480996 RepID=A0ABP4TKN3_9ACTN